MSDITIRSWSAERGSCHIKLSLEGDASVSAEKTFEFSFGFQERLASEILSLLGSGLAWIKSGGTEHLIVAGRGIEMSSVDDLAGKKVRAALTAPSETVVVSVGARRFVLDVVQTPSSKDDAPAVWQEDDANIRKQNSIGGVRYEF